MSMVRLRSWSLNRDVYWQRMLGDVAFTTQVLRRLLVLRPKPDVLLVVTNPFVLVAAAHVHKLVRRVPYVYLLHDVYPDILVALGALRRTSLAARLLHRLQKAWLHGASRVITLGRCMRERVSEDYDLPAEHSIVLTNWSDLERVAPDPLTTVFRSKHGIEGFMVLYSGNIGRFHDVDTVLDAAKLLRNRVPDVTFAFVGRGGKRADVETRIRAEHLDNVRTFDLVPEEDLPDLLASANVNLVTLASGTRGLAVPLKFYNALAAERPVVAVMEENEVTNVLDEAECGLHVRPGRGDDLAEIIANLATSRARCSIMGRRARETAIERYSLGVVARQYAAIVKQHVQ